MWIEHRPAIILALLLAAALGCRAAAPAAAPTAPTLPTSAQAGGASIVAIAPPAQPCCPKQTLPQFLGLTGACEGIKTIIGRIRNRLGAIWPGLEAKPEVLAITDPKNLESPNPAISSAAEVKAAEDEAAQKAKAIAYLASIGCAGCYPGIEDALLAALDDCTELVRFETAKALRSTALYPCKNCCKSACCGPKIREKLMKIAYETDAQGCYLESSDRVRRMARLALEYCNCVPEKPTQQQQNLPAEGPGAEVAPAADGPPAGATATAQRPPAGGTSPVGKPVTGSLVRKRNPASADQQRSHPASYEDALRAYSNRESGAPQAEVAWEIWTARPSAFPSREAATAAIMLARAEIMGSESGRYVPPQFSHASYEWTDPVKIGSEGIARAVATVPAGGVSSLIEDRSGWHLVRVVARRAAPVPTPATPNSAQPVGYESQFGQPPAAAAAPQSPAASILRVRPSGQVAPSVVAVRLPDCNCK